MFSQQHWACFPPISQLISTSGASQQFRLGHSRVHWMSHGAHCVGGWVLILKSTEEERKTVSSHLVLSTSRSTRKLWMYTWMYQAVPSHTYNQSSGGPYRTKWGEVVAATCSVQFTGKLGWTPPSKSWPQSCNVTLGWTKVHPTSVGGSTWVPWGTMLLLCTDFCPFVESHFISKRQFEWFHFFYL